MWSGGGTYNGWATFLERWGAGEATDSTHLPPLEPADFTGDTWERLVLRLTDAISRRLRSWADALTRAMAESTDEFTVGRALSQARSGLRAVRDLAQHPGLPQDLRDRLVDLVDRQVDSAQQSLEEQVDRMRSNGVDAQLVEARRRTIRDNPLTAVAATQQATSPAPTTGDWFVDPAGTGRRRVILD
ncbi:MAG: hypothetical protein ACRDT0_16465 [Pseudonocardiaceae bacterium]